MTALSDLLTQAADIARNDGHLWLVSRIGEDLMRLDEIEFAAARSATPAEVPDAG